MGSRLMGRWILNPLLDKRQIEHRQEFVSSFISDENVRDYILESMSEISDIERITSKIALNRAVPREIIYLKNSLLSVQDLKLQLKNSSFNNLKSWANDIPKSREVIKKIDESLNDDASLLSSGKVIKTGYNKELDRLRSISDGGKNILLKIQNEEIEKTGISS